MPYGQIVIGPPGSGKSTYCHGLQQFFRALERDVRIVNLDPANDALPYACALDITELIQLRDVMDEYGLGPNGGMIYCLEYLEENIDWLLDGLKELREQEGADYFVFDMPGQVELSTNHDSLKNIVKKLDKAGYRLASINLTDAFHVTDASKYISVLLLSLRTMLQLELPHLNVLSKVDLITTYGELPFNLDFYTEVQDLNYLQYELEKDPRARRGRFIELNKAICDIVEDFGLVGFQTLCVEDKMSMASLVKNIDRILGCVPHTHTHSSAGGASESAAAETMKTPFELLHDFPDSHFPSARDVQERYVDREKEHADFERERWRREGEQVWKKESERSKTEAIKREKDSMQRQEVQHRQQ